MDKKKNFKKLKTYAKKENIKMYFFPTLLVVAGVVVSSIAFYGLIKIIIGLLNGD